MLPARRVLMPTSMAFAAVARRGFATSAARFQDPSRPYRDQRTQNFVKIFRRLAVTLGTFLGFGLIYSYAPPMRTSTREGKAFDKYLAKDWEKTEIREGDLGHKETDEQRKEEQEYRASHQGQAKGNFP